MSERTRGNCCSHLIDWSFGWAEMREAEARRRRQQVVALGTHTRRFASFGETAVFAPPELHFSNFLLTHNGPTCPARKRPAPLTGVGRRTSGLVCAPAS